MAWANKDTYHCLAGDTKRGWGREGGYHLCLTGCRENGNKESSGSLLRKEVTATSDNITRRKGLAFTERDWKDLIRKRSEGLNQI